MREDVCRLITRFVKGYLSLAAMMAFIWGMAIWKGRDWRVLIIGSPVYILIFIGITYQLVKEIRELIRKNTEDKSVCHDNQRVEGERQLQNDISSLIKRFVKICLALVLLAALYWGVGLKNGSSWSTLLTWSSLLIILLIGIIYLFVRNWKALKRRDNENRSHSNE